MSYQLHYRTKRPIKSIYTDWLPRLFHSPGYFSSQIGEDVKTEMILGILLGYFEETMASIAELREKVEREREEENNQTTIHSSTCNTISSFQYMQDADPN